MANTEWLVEGFEAERARLRAVAFRMLGSEREAEDAVQEAWLRLARTDATVIENLGGWLTTVVARVSLDMLRSRSARREDPGLPDPDGTVDRRTPADPEAEVVLADSVGAALLVVLDTLTPAERLAFVLHDLFDVPFEQIATIVHRTPGAARQLASRARRKVQGSGPAAGPDPARQRAVVDAFLAASRGGRFDALVALLDPEVELDADPAGVRMGAPAWVVGSRAVAEVFSGRAKGARSALIDGAAGMVWMVQGRPRVVWDFSVVDDRIVQIACLADSDTLDQLDLVLDG